MKIFRLGVLISIRCPRIMEKFITYCHTRFEFNFSAKFCSISGRSAFRRRHFLCLNWMKRIVRLHCDLFGCCHACDSMRWAVGVWVCMRALRPLSPLIVGDEAHYFSYSRTRILWLQTFFDLRRNFFSLSLFCVLQFCSFCSDHSSSVLSGRARWATLCGERVSDGGRRAPARQTMAKYRRKYFPKLSIAFTVH